MAKKKAASATEASVPSPATPPAPSPPPAAPVDPIDPEVALKARGFELDPTGTWRHKVHPAICCHPAALQQVVRLHGPAGVPQLFAAYDREIKLQDLVRSGKSYEEALAETDPQTAS